MTAQPSDALDPQAISMDQLVIGSTTACYTNLIAAIDKALTELAKPAPITDRGVHTVRKALKKARAGLRLLRESLDEEVYRRENATLRDVGRRISGLRDSKSLIGAFDSLRNGSATHVRHSSFSRAKAILRAKQKNARDQFARDKPDQQKQSSEVLENCRAEIGNWSVAKGDPITIQSGLRRIYRNARKRFEDARSDSSAEAMHEWRKHVKYLANALGMVTGKKRDGAYKKRLDKLADFLGDEHDLALLARELASPSFQLIDAPFRVELISLANQQREELKARAFSLGRDLYELKPKQWMVRYQPSFESGRISSLQRQVLSLKIS